MVDTATQVAQFLQTYGGWGISVILAFTIVKLYLHLCRAIREKDTLIQELNTTHHAEMVAVVRECTGVLTAVREALQRCEDRQIDHRRIPQ